MVWISKSKVMWALMAGILMAASLSFSPAQAESASRNAAPGQVRYSRVGLLPPSCDDRSRLMLGPGHDDATVRHNQLAHSMRHNFKGYQIKPKCAFQQVGGAVSPRGR